jgi:hypothetical protein
VIPDGRLIVAVPEDGPTTLTLRSVVAPSVILEPGKNVTVPDPAYEAPLLLVTVEVVPKFTLPVLAMPVNAELPPIIIGPLPPIVKAFAPTAPVKTSVDIDPALFETPRAPTNGPSIVRVNAAVVPVILPRKLVEANAVNDTAVEMDALVPIVSPAVTLNEPVEPSTVNVTELPIDKFGNTTAVVPTSSDVKPVTLIVADEPVHTAALTSCVPDWKVNVELEGPVKVPVKVVEPAPVLTLKVPVPSNVTPLLTVLEPVFVNDIPQPVLTVTAATILAAPASTNDVAP